jgi:hypothetical protein
VKAALPQWCQRKGWGLLLLLYSLLLTRGCSVVVGDMDEAGTPLVDGLGYCSMELVNLMLTGGYCVLLGQFVPDLWSPCAHCTKYLL